jgi:hypothetical protein
VYSRTLRVFGFDTLPSNCLLRKRLVGLVFALALFELSQTAQAVTTPPDGGYPNDNTAEGTGASETVPLWMATTLPQ